jgi:hypothetical protein
VWSGELDQCDQKGERAGLANSGNDVKADLGFVPRWLDARVAYATIIDVNISSGERIDHGLHNHKKAEREDQRVFKVLSFSRIESGWLLVGDRDSNQGINSRDDDGEDNEGDREAQLPDRNDP